MAYFIFNKNGDNVEGTLSRIAENINDLNNLNITQSVYKIIEDTLENFNLVKLEKKIALSYNNDSITYINFSPKFNSKEDLKESINEKIKNIQNFINLNPNHPDKNKWNNYISQLKNFDTNTINYPLTKSLEEHFNDIGQTSLNILQLP
jgi:hypothetical protein